MNASKKPAPTLDRINATTQRNRDYADTLIARVLAYFADPDNEKRLDAGLCAYCFYIERGGLYGQAFTTVPCAQCEKAMTFPSTRTDYVCADCGARLGICVHCGGDRDGRPRTKLHRKRGGYGRF